MSNNTAADAIMMEATAVDAEEEHEQRKSTEDEAAATGGTGASADGEGEEEEEEVTSEGGKKKKKPADPVDVPKPDDFEERTKDSWKPDAFPDNENYHTLFTEIRAKHAEQCLEECVEAARKYVSSGLWPKGKLEIVVRSALQLRKAAAKAKADFEKQQAASAQSAAERADEKQKQLASFKSAVSMAFTDTLNRPDLVDKPLTERVPFAIEECLKVVKDFAAKINSWKEGARNKAIEIAQTTGAIARADIEAALAAATEEASKPVAVDASPSSKKRKTADDEPSLELSPEDLVTPQKPAVASAADAEKSPCEPPPQSAKHKDGKKQKKGKASPTGVEAAPTAQEVA